MSKHRPKYGTFCRTCGTREGGKLPPYIQRVVCACRFTPGQWVRVKLCARCSLPVRFQLRQIDMCFPLVAAP